MSENQKYLACTFTNGMFGKEYAVEIEILGTPLSLFATASDVKITDEHAGKGLLRVRIVDPDREVIALPSETLQQGRRFFHYPLEQLQTA